MVAVTLFALLGAGVHFHLWRTAQADRIEADPDRKIATTANGIVEYALVGDGDLHILMLHGSPGGYDQSLVGIRAAPESFLPGTKTIAVSRPGSLGTPLESGATLDAEADLYVALLDQLAIQKVLVIATSAGGRAGLSFVLRHSDRSLGLVLRSARIIEKTEGTGDVTPPLASDILMWIGSFAPSMWIGGFDPSDPIQVQMAELMVSSAVPNRNRLAGAQNSSAQFADSPIEDWSLELITVPTLIIHGDADSLVPPCECTRRCRANPRRAIAHRLGRRTLHVRYATARTLRAHHGVRSQAETLVH